ncbi:MAG: adenine phosphoribosyltransferase [Deltaproteobacteria bacterium]|jgi:adenine phosphoribosyltransferase|nr:adenine phosphoribosyltransferase [Deltaproteobacteria bacterium]
MASSDASTIDLRALIRDVPDFPKPGILFRDVTPLLGNGPAFRACIGQLAGRLAPLRPQAIAGIESRGFIFGAAVAMELGIGFLPIRKPGKLPWKTRKEAYALEYGSDAIEVHEDAVAAGTRVALVDDLLATGGTAGAAIKLLQGLGAEVVAAAFVIELAILEGRARLGSVPCQVLIAYA